MDLEKRPPHATAGQPPAGQADPRPPQAEGCLAVAIRLPVRIVVLVLVVPVRLVWDALAVCGRFVYLRGLRPVGRAIAAVLTWLLKAVFVWPWVGLWRYVAVPVGTALAWLGRMLVVVPAAWLHRAVLAPIGHGIARLALGIGRGVAWLAGGVWTVLATLFRWIFVVPVVAVWRWVLAPLGRAVAVVAREIGDALGHAWRVAGHLSLVVGRFLAKLLRWIFVEPVRWVYRTLLTPVGHLVRDAVWRPAARAATEVRRATRQALAAARHSVRQARADVRRALFGAPKEAVPVAVPAPRRTTDTPEPRNLEKNSGKAVSPPVRG
ncbi:hypothetical protein ABZ366_19080 [Streptomyces sp. NPDC005904]|uniref:hypothetical protein n=1 Tax=Streptomyces sp. NPDC005904 TaxID=3154570 RepID=UPI0033FB3070